MIADGLSAAFPNARRVSVDLATIRFTDPKTERRYIYLTPRPAQLALLSFDAGDKPDPFVVQGTAAQIVDAAAAKAAARPATGRKPRQRAKLIPQTRSGSRTVPIKQGGTPPGLGSLARGAGANKAGSVRTGRVRSFGLKSMATRPGGQ